MRNIYRGCAALAVAAGGLFYGTAEYTARNPSSLVGRCVVAAYQVTMTFGPLLHSGTFLVGNVAGVTENSADCNFCCILPEEPEPVVLTNFEPCPGIQGMPTRIAAVSDPNRGRLPGKIIIDDTEEPPLAKNKILEYYGEGSSHHLKNVELFYETSEPASLKMVDGEGAIEIDSVTSLTARAVEAVSKLFSGQTTIKTLDAMMPSQGDSGVVHAFASTEARVMPYCHEDEGEARTMPRADGEEAKVKPASTPIQPLWLPKGTEVGGGDESEPGRLGNDCREDPTGPLQVPGCPYPANRPKTGKANFGSEEQSEPPPANLEKKKSKRDESQKSRRSFDELKPFPKLAHPEIDTMEFRPSDWGKDDVPLPPF